MAEPGALGRYGEQLAAQYLQRRGYALLAANVRCRFGEIDLIAARGGFLVFVEVKQRKSDRYGSAGAYVDARKQRRIRLTAEYWLQRHPDGRQPRFDVIEVYLPYGTATKYPKLNHLENAF